MNDLPTRSFAVKNGLLLGALLSGWAYFVNSTNLFMNQGLGMMVYLIYLAGIIYTLRQYRLDNGGFMTFKQGLGLGVLMSVVAGLISSVFSLIYMKVIDPGFMDRMLEMMRDKMAEQPGMTEEALEMAMTWVGKMRSPVVIFISGLVTSALIGLFFSLIVSAIMKKERPEGGVMEEPMEQEVS
jgi:hypothetical protein